MVGSPIYLVRHAETTLNAARVVQYPDTPLSSHGRWQARRLAEHLRRQGIARVVSSDYARARTTAETICDASKATLTVDPILRERHLGELRGRPYAEVREQVFSEHFDPANGETWTDFTDRIDRLWMWVHELPADGRGRPGDRHPRPRVPRVGRSPLPGARRRALDVWQRLRHCH